MRRIMIVTATVALAVGAVACAQDDAPEQAEGGTEHGGGDHAGHPAGGGGETRKIGGVSANDHGAWDVSNLDGFDLELDDSYFGPTVLMGAAGQELTLELHNEGDLPHSFTIDGAIPAAIEQVVDPGTEGVTQQVVFPEEGAVLFYCRFHRDQGMVGALSVGPLDQSANVAGTSAAGSDTGGYG